MITSYWFPSNQWPRQLIIRIILDHATCALQTQVPAQPLLLSLSWTLATMSIQTLATKHITKSGGELKLLAIWAVKSMILWFFLGSKSVRSWELGWAQVTQTHLVISSHLSGQRHEEKWKFKYTDDTPKMGKQIPLETTVFIYIYILPTVLKGPGWLGDNPSSEPIVTVFRAPNSMDLSLQDIG